MTYWVKFSDGSGGSCPGDSKEDAMLQASILTGKTAVEADHLPYPASPVIKSSGCPPFCYTPELCKGRNSCPKSYACSE